MQMKEELNAILVDLKEIRGQLDKIPSSKFEETLRVLEKLVIPIMLAVMTGVGSLAAYRISNGQLDLSAQSAAESRNEFDRSMQAKAMLIKSSAGMARAGSVAVSGSARICPWYRCTSNW
jgi:hypothetical protein